MFRVPCSAQSSSDAIAIRVVSNGDHYSAQRWYAEKGFSGSPQALKVDGYEAVRDGRTVYVNAANVVLDPEPVLYTNIYIISYNQEAEQATRDIFAQILKYWSFNNNLAQGETFSGDTSACSKDPAVVCITDKDCGDFGYCSSAKAQVTRDTLRLSRLYDIDYAIQEYGQAKGEYPKLPAGTYLPGITLSVWPSWQNVLAQVLGGSSLSVDPINQLDDCGHDRFHPVTCWDEREKEFAWTEDIKIGELPDNDSRVLLYKYGPPSDPNSYTLCAASETGLFPDASKMCNSGCIPFCFNKECGLDGCGGDCGECGPSETCDAIGKCQPECSTGPGCRDALMRGHAVAGYCETGKKCYECDTGWYWSGGECLCDPDDSCKLNTCTGHTCQDHCGNSYEGVKPPDCSCQERTCIGETCPDGCGGACPGARDCACTPDCSCAETTCRGTTCPDPICGTACKGEADCGTACIETCPTGPGCQLGEPANTKLAVGTCCESGQYCRSCLPGYTWNGTDCECSEVTIAEISDHAIYAYHDYTNGTGIPELHYSPTELSFGVAAMPAAQISAYAISVSPPPPKKTSIQINAETGEFFAQSRDNSAIGEFNVTVSAISKCGSHGSESFKLNIAKNAWCGDGNVDSPIEDCEEGGAGTGPGDQWVCTDCHWLDSGWCGDGIVNPPFEECENNGGGTGKNDQYVCTNCRWLNSGWCGDGNCNPEHETCENCSEDCGPCGPWCVWGETFSGVDCGGGNQDESSQNSFDDCKAWCYAQGRTCAAWRSSDKDCDCTNGGENKFDSSPGKNAALCK